MSTAVTHLITVGDKTVELTYDEATLVAQGEIPRKMATRLEELGVTLPPRGSIRYYHEIRLGDKVIRTEAHMRRIPDWERKKAA